MICSYERDMVYMILYGMSKRIPLVIFQLKARIEKKTSMSIQKRSVMEQTMPSLVTGTGAPNTSVNRNQGKGNLERRRIRSFINRFENLVQEKRGCIIILGLNNKPVGAIL